MDLHSETTKHSWFRIMPRYKVHTEGDRIRMNDQVPIHAPQYIRLADSCASQIMLESVKTPGQYLHVSAQSFGEIHPSHDSFEVNLSFQASAFTIYPHVGWKDYQPTHVRGGSVVQLFHKERDAYIAAEGNHLNPIIEDVHLRIREPDPTKPNRLFPPTSAVSVCLSQSSTCIDSSFTGMLLI